MRSQKGRQFFYVGKDFSKVESKDNVSNSGDQFDESGHRSYKNDKGDGDEASDCEKDHSNSDSKHDNDNVCGQNRETNDSHEKCNDDDQVGLGEQTCGADIEGNGVDYDETHFSVHAPEDANVVHVKVFLYIYIYIFCFY